MGLAVILHTTDGKPIAFHPGRDRVFAAGRLVEIEITEGSHKGQRVTVKESKAQIEKHIRDAEI